MYERLPDIDQLCPSVPPHSREGGGVSHLPAGSLCPPLERPPALHRRTFGTGILLAVLRIRIRMFLGLRIRIH
jgi:hypothetical protein